MHTGIAQPNRDRRVSVGYLVACAALITLATTLVFLIQRGILPMWPCALHELTGLYCLTCGATRAAVALWHLRLMESLLFNPLPILLALSMLVVIGFESAALIGGRRIRVDWIPWTALMHVCVLFIFFVLRNTGVLPGI